MKHKPDVAYIMRKIHDLQENVEMGFFETALYTSRLIQGEILMYKDRARKSPIITNTHPQKSGRELTKR